VGAVNRDVKGGPREMLSCERRGRPKVLLAGWWSIPSRGRGVLAELFGNGGADWRKWEALGGMFL